jgi:hypothetical protein
MATVSGSKTTLDSPNARVYSWTAIGNGDDGSPLEAHDHADRSVQVIGTFGSGGTLVLEGSNDGTNWVTLTDPQGNDVSFTAAGIEQVQEITRYMRPNCTAGDGNYRS